MRSIALGFHEVIGERDRALMMRHRRNVYTLQLTRFREVLEAVGRRALPGLVWGARSLVTAAERVYLTFDDGADNAYTHVADELERCGWRGHFFVVAGWIGRRGSLNERQIRALHRRGHVIGSHSLTHPERMSALSWTDLIREWSHSCTELGAVIGEPIRVASIPGGYYHDDVASAAAACGLEVLFTSEPTAAVWRIDGCFVLGRYAVRRFTQPATVAAIAAAARVPRLLQSAAWFGSKAIKAIAGEHYYNLRRNILNHLLGSGRRATHS